MADEQTHAPTVAHYTRRSRKITAKKLMIMEREDLCLELYTAGSSYRQISDHLATKGYEGCSKSNVGNDIASAIKRSREESKIKGKQIVEVELQRLNKMTLALWPRLMTNAKPKDIQAMLKIMDRRSKMLGLDRPKKVDISANESLAALLGVPKESIPHGDSNS